MLTEFHQMPAESRIWIYQADRELTDSEVADAEKLTKHFISGWQSHGKPLKASFKIFYNRFIIISVDESYYSASGCSIDSSVELIRALEKELDIRLLDRGIITYLSNGKILQTNIGKLKEEIGKGNITPDTIVFNNAISYLKDLEENWQISAGKTWMSRYFPALA